MYKGSLREYKENSNLYDVNMKLAKLEELEKIKPFDCGDADLNN